MIGKLKKIRNQKLVRIFIIVLSTIFIIAKDGFDLYGYKHLKESAALFPAPYDATSSSYLPVLLLKISNLNEAQWNFLNFFLIIMLIFVVGFNFLSRFKLKQGFIIFSIFLNSPSITILFQQIGHYQTLFIITSVLFTLFRNKNISFICGLLMVLSAPEFSFISLLLLYIWSKGSGVNDYLHRIIIFINLALLFSLLNFVLLKNAGAAGRLDALMPNLAKSVGSFISSGYLGVYAGWGSIWIILILTIRSYQQKKTSLIYMTSAVFFIPLGFYIIMSDGTRIFVGLTSILLLPIIFLFANLNTMLIKSELMVLLWFLPNYVSEIGSPFFKLPFEFLHSDKLKILNNLFR